MIFEPMYSEAYQDYGLLLLGIAFVGFLVGMYWIHRITKDIEDN